jgi:hypothetical protein
MPLNFHISRNQTRRNMKNCLELVVKANVSYPIFIYKLLPHGSFSHLAEFGQVLLTFSHLIVGAFTTIHRLPKVFRLFKFDRFRPCFVLFVPSFSICFYYASLKVYRCLADFAIFGPSQSISSLLLNYWPLALFNKARIV